MGSVIGEIESKNSEYEPKLFDDSHWLTDKDEAVTADSLSAPLPAGFSLVDDKATPDLPEGFTEITNMDINADEPDNQISLPSDSMQSSDNQTTMSLEDVNKSNATGIENKEQIKQVGYGAAQSVPLPIGKAVEDTLSHFGIDIGTHSSNVLHIVNKKIDKYNKEHPDQTIHPATIGNALSQLAVPAAKTIKATAITEAFLNTLAGIGKTEDYDDVYTDAATGAVFGAGSLLLFNRLTRDLGPLSYEAKLLIYKHPELSEGAIIEALHGVPRGDQAYAITNMVQDDFVPFMDKAVELNRDRLLVKQQLSGRTNIVKNIIGDTENQVKEATKYFGEMTKEIDEKFPNLANFEHMVPDLDKVVKRYDGTHSNALSIAKGLQADINEGNGFMSAGTAIKFRKGLNKLIDKSDNHDEKAMLIDMKTRVNTFIDGTLDKQHSELVKAATTNYRRAKNNEKFMEIMNKHISKDATDWVALKADLKKAKLNSQEITDAVDIIKAYSTKFKNDANLRGTTKLKGQKADSGGMISTYSYAINQLKDTFRFWGERYRELKIQKALLKSIRQAKRPEDLVERMKYNGVPDKTIKDMQTIVVNDYSPVIVEDIVPNHTEIPYKPSTPTGDTIIIDGQTVPTSDVSKVLPNLSDDLKSTPVGSEVQSKIQVGDNQLDLVKDTLPKIPKEDVAERIDTDTAINSRELSVDAGAARYVTKADTEANRVVPLISKQVSHLEDSLGIKLGSDKASKLDKIVNGKRTERIVKNIRNRMKPDDKPGNVKYLKDTIRREASIIRRRAKKNLGIDIPIDDAERIYKMKLKDCK